VPAAESYPDDLRYHSEHDWARIDGDEATLGVTWFAQDSLGELVHYEAPEAGSTVTKDASYGEGGLIRIRMSDASELDALMDAGAYRAHVAEQ
jgi:glycine cleavage system H lipoate-binding protein